MEINHPRIKILSSKAYDRLINDLQSNYKDKDENRITEYTITSRSLSFIDDFQIEEFIDCLRSEENGSKNHSPNYFMKEEPGEIIEDRLGLKLLEIKNSSFSDEYLKMNIKYLIDSQIDIIFIPGEYLNHGYQKRTVRLLDFFAPSESFEYKCLEEQIQSRLSHINFLISDIFGEDSIVEWSNNYCNYYKGISMSDKSKIEKVGFVDVEVIQIIKTKVDELNVKVFCQISRRRPVIKLVHISLAIVVVFMSHDVDFVIKKQGKKTVGGSQRKNLGILVKYIIEQKELSSKYLKDKTSLLNLIYKICPSKQKSEQICYELIKIILTSNLTMIKKISTQDISDYFSNSKLFGLAKKSNQEEIQKVIYIVEGILKNAGANFDLFFLSHPIVYLKNHIKRQS